MRYLFLIFTALLALNLSAQNSQGEADDAGRIAICPVIGNIPDMPEAAEKILLTKMAQITTKNGLGSYGNRFIMYPKVNIMSKDITPTAPTMHVYNLSVTMYIADNVTQTIFASASLDLQGVGKNPTKAYISALKGLNYTTPEVKNFVKEGKRRIIEYYNSQCDFILKDAETAAKQKEFEKAIYSLISIPDICKECYMKAQDLSITIYKQKIENECMQNITQAKVAKAQWFANAVPGESWKMVKSKAKSWVAAAWGKRCHLEKASVAKNNQAKKALKAYLLLPLCLYYEAHRRTRQQ